MLSFLKNKRGLVRPDMPEYVVIQDNVRFHYYVREWFAAHLHTLIEFLPSYSAFLNSAEELFSLCIHWPHKPDVSFGGNGCCF